mgnify:CR=1 FL=1
MALKDSTKQKLMGISAATICTALYKRGFRNQVIQGARPINPNLPNMVGEAFTLRYIPAREDLNPITVFQDRNHPQRAAIEQCPPGAVMVIPLLFDDDGAPHLVLERQYRYPIGQVMIEFPAGKLDPGEDRLACARRELQEETGYVARQWARAGVIHPVISYSTEFIEIWFAKDLTAGERRLDAGEFLDVFTATPTQLAAWCREGVVTDAKTVAGMLWVNAVLSGEWRLEWDEPIP